MNVLNVETITTIPDIIIISILSVLLCFLLSVVITRVDGDYELFKPIFIIMAILCLAIVIPTMVKRIGINRYEVILDESYPMTEFYEKYEVIGRRGSIWIIQDKR